MQRISMLAGQIRDYVNMENLYSRKFNNAQEWNRLCVALDTLEDSGLALTYYESSGIGQTYGEKYLKLYGLLQAVTLQQDSIKELYGVFVGGALEFNRYPALYSIRRLRNLTAGHPLGVRPGKGETAVRRVFVSRVSISDKGYKLICWNTATGKDEIEDKDLQGLYRAYKDEAVQLLTEIIGAEKGALPDHGVV